MLSVPPGRWPLIGVVMLVALLGMRPPALPVRNAPGLAYTITTITERKDLEWRPGIDTTVVTEQFTGDNIRWAFIHLPIRFTRDTGSVSSAFGFGRGEYMVGRRGSPVVTVIDTVRKRYFDTDMGAVMRSSLGLTQSELKAGDTVFTVRVQPDTTLDGLRAEHWRLTDNHTATEAIATSHPLFTVRTTTDEYIALESADLEFFPFGELPHPLLAGYAYSRGLRDARAKLPRGLYLLTITRRVSVFGGNRAGFTETETQRISDIRRADISPDVFAVPAGYQRVAPPPSASSPHVRSN